MAKPHWIHDEETGHHGCQHTPCTQPAEHQWARAATDTEMETEHHLEGPYGKVHRNPNGPHNVAVFACGEHTLTPDAMTIRHAAECPAPDPGCECA